jgi:flavin reductase (DIM6/NTAB) family NADH-FMN oxidoreductase RutF
VRREVGGQADEVLASKLDRSEAYKLLVGSVVPRAIAWVSTVSTDGRRNLAPFSFFTVASPDPPTLLFSVGPSTRMGIEHKDTLANVRATGQMTINAPSVSNLDGLVATSIVAPPGDDEFVIGGLTAEPSVLVDPPRVAEAPIAMECELDRTLRVGGNHLVLARILLWRFAPDIRVDGKVDMERMQPLGRLAGPRFVTSMDMVVRPSPQAE